MIPTPIESRDMAEELLEPKPVEDVAEEVGIKVDRDELIKALAYDRKQYEKGYVDGYRAAKDEIVRCKDSKFWFRNNGHDKNGCPITDSDIWMDDSGFCCYGERKDDAENH